MARALHFTCAGFSEGGHSAYCRPIDIDSRYSGGSGRRRGEGAEPTFILARDGSSLHGGLAGLRRRFVQLQLGLCRGHVRSRALRVCRLLWRVPVLEPRLLRDGKLLGLLLGQLLRPVQWLLRAVCDRWPPPLFIPCGELARPLGWVLRAELSVRVLQRPVLFLLPRL